MAESKIERIKMVKAMEYIARNLNDEDGISLWLMYGVADGDIEYGDLSVKDEDFDEYGFGYFIEDKHFAELMGIFLIMMNRAFKPGGLCCDGVVSSDI